LAAIGQSASIEETVASPFREAVAGLEGFELLAEAEIGKAVVDHYVDHPEFLWVSDSDVNERAREAVRVLGEAASHGLDPAEYGISIPASPAGASGEAARRRELLRFEMEMTARMLRYASDALRGR